MTYEELVDFMKVDETVVVCKNFQQRRDAVNILLDMGFEYEPTTEDYLNESEESGDERFLNPGISNFQILCYNSQYAPYNSINFSEVMEIMTRVDEVKDKVEDDKEFEKRFHVLMKGE